MAEHNICCVNMTVCWK